MPFNKPNETPLNLIITCSGEMLGDLGRLSKSVFYESASRVPFIVRPAPSSLMAETHRQAPPRESDLFVELIDIHATLLEIAGASTPRQTDSRSVWPLVCPRTPVAESAVGHHTTKEWRSNVLSEVHQSRNLRARLVLLAHCAFATPLPPLVFVIHCLTVCTI